METLCMSATLLLVDDQTMMLDGIEALMGTIAEVEVVARATTGMQAVEMAAVIRPDLVLMDINMPGMDGIEATKRLLKASPESKVVVLSMYGHREFVLELLDAGASGYLLKSAGKAELMEAFTMALAGRRYVAQELQLLIAHGDRFKDRRGESIYGSLTKREVEIIKQILAERTTQEIADKLFLSAQTVETHRKNIMHKLDVRNTAGLVKYAMERGWDTN